MKKISQESFWLKLIAFSVLFSGCTLQGFSQNKNSLRIDSVSVIPGLNHVMIGWTLETEETEGSIAVKRQVGETFEDIALFSNLSVSNYIDNGVDANSGSFRYFLAAFKTGGSTMAESYSHRTIHLLVPNSDFCVGEVKLMWENYQVTTTSGTPVQQPVPFDSLRVQVSTDGSNFFTYATLPHPQPPMNLQIQEYDISGMEPGQYFFRIQAFNSVIGHSSTSNIRSFGFNPPEIKNLAIVYIDIFENSEARISFSASGQTEEFFYELHRSDEADQNYEMLGVSPVISVFSDDPEISDGPWFYNIKAYLKDWECELPATESEGPFSSIFLQAESQAKTNEVLLKWEHHFPAGRFFSYDLKVMPLYGQWESVPSFTGMEPGQFIHSIAPGELVGNVIYKMEATDLSDPAIVISSNYVSAYAEPVLYIPNAFRPTSQAEENKIFRPFFVGFTPEAYQLIVFNRWGQSIFSSTDPDQAWDGNIGGKAAAPGVYSFLLKYSAPGAQKLERRGVVTLVY